MGFCRRFHFHPQLVKTDGLESDVTKLFACAGSSAATHCLQNLPSESQTRATTIEVQKLLVYGRRKEVLHCAVEGQLWDLALELGKQLHAFTREMGCGCCSQVAKWLSVSLKHCLAGFKTVVQYQVETSHYG
ncbi:hypothetical protein H6P81_013125 [Aristolochia fimbriata]|uniref:Uncharacterized protein n=1 Tax=Aristolochia fimbriata TaxID=158543 RepID=A0AAV7EHE7_ARIFI|nr:hypothetical protein H6P81_013125 [Aristolochia fimbriata]